MAVGVGYMTAHGNAPLSWYFVQSGRSAPDSAYTDIRWAASDIQIYVARSGLLGGIGGPNGSFPLYALQSHQTVTVEVITDVAHIRASPTFVPPNTQVTFTAYRDDSLPLTVNYWMWQPDAGEAGSTSFPCASSNPCHFSPAGSGTMMVSTSVGNATTHVVVKKCPNTGDSVLDDGQVRYALDSLMKMSYPDSTPGTGTSATNWQNTGFPREQGLWIVQHSDGSYYTIPANGTWDGCSFKASPPQGFGTDKVVALVHTHPAKPHDRVYGNCTAVDQFNQPHPAKHYPGDPNGSQGFGTREYNTGGGSQADWAMPNDPAYEPFGVDFYVMNSSGEIWKLPSGWTWDQRLNDRSSRQKNWKTSSCKWP